MISGRSELNSPPKQDNFASTSAKPLKHHIFEFHVNIQ